MSRAAQILKKAIDDHKDSSAAPELVRDDLLFAILERLDELDVRLDTIEQKIDLLK